MLFANNKIVVGGSTGLKSTVYGVWSEMIYREAFKRLGYNFEYIGFPAARAKYRTTLTVQSKALSGYY